MAAYINGLLCASTKVERSGQWSLQIRGDARCGPMPGSVVAFTLNGSPAGVTPRAVWYPRSRPLSTYGYTLTSTQPAPVGDAVPALFYGAGLPDGSQVTALINGVSCASSTVGSAGMWTIKIATSAPCAPSNGAAVGFTVSGHNSVATPPASWQPGGIGSYALAHPGAGTTTPPPEHLPYQAYGVGLATGQTVAAYNRGTQVASAVVDAGGNWVFNVPTTSAANGDTIAFTINGRATNETIVFQAGGFAIPPGIALTLSSGSGAGTFVTPPVFGAGTAALVVFAGGTVDQLEAATAAAGAAGAWVQDSTGAFRLLIVGSPAFLKEAFAVAFPGGFTTMTGVTVTRH